MSALRPRAVLVDAHGTLIELEPPAPMLQRVLLQRHGIALPADVADAGMRAEIAYYRAHMHEGRDPGSVDALRSRCAEELRQSLLAAAPVVAPAVDRLSASEMTSVLLGALVFKVFDDVIPALESLRALGCAIVVVSNWDASLGQRLAELGLGALLDGVVSSAAFGAAKPSEAIFVEGLRLAGGVAPSEAVHVGDSVEADVVGARAAGVEPVLLVRGGIGGGCADGVRTIGSLAELVAPAAPGTGDLWMQIP